MRHFLCLARAPGALMRGVPTRSAVAQLIALTGTVQRLAPAPPRTPTGTVEIATVAVAADAHLLRAASAAVESIGLLACPHAPRYAALDKPRIAGIKAKRTRPYAREHAEGPGFFPGMYPGLRFFPAFGLEDSAKNARQVGELSRISHIAIRAPSRSKAV